MHREREKDNFKSREVKRLKECALALNNDVISQLLSLLNIVFLMMYIFIKVYLFINMILMSCYVFATQNLGRIKCCYI